MKAISVIDMPKKCVECSLANRDTIVEFCKITGKEIPIIFSSNEEYEEIRNDDCPLKPMPQRRYSLECGDSDGNRWKEPSEYDNGYNACIDEILGEEENA